jgi:hypothetical protein
MDRTIRTDDVVVCRVNGTQEFYVVGTVLSGKVGELRLRGVSTMGGRQVALRHAYDGRMPDCRVWLFDGAAAAYVETNAPDASVL